MKKTLYVLLAALFLGWVCTPSWAAEPSPAMLDLRELIGKVQAKLQQGKTNEADLSDELKQFDALLAKHKGEKTNDLAQILFMKARLYDQVLKNEKKADELDAQLQKQFPDSMQAKMLTEQAAAKKVRAALKEGAPFPDFDEKDLDGKPLSIANYKGKVVLIDFWATWCGPCVGELPNVLKTYEKHHSQGFEIIGVSLDEDKEKLTSFLADKKMTWQQYFDGKGWHNKLAEKYGIQSIPATYLLDGQGKIIGQNLRGEELEAAVSKALEKKEAKK